MLRHLPSTLYGPHMFVFMVLNSGAHRIQLFARHWLFNRVKCHQAVDHILFSSLRPNRNILCAKRNPHFVRWYEHFSAQRKLFILNENFFDYDISHFVPRCKLKLYEVETKFRIKEEKKAIKTFSSSGFNFWNIRLKRQWTTVETVLWLCVEKGENYTRQTFLFCIFHHWIIAETLCERVSAKHYSSTSQTERTIRDQTLRSAVKYGKKWATQIKNGRRIIKLKSFSCLISWASVIHAIRTFISCRCRSN